MKKNNTFLILFMFSSFLYGQKDYELEGRIIAQTQDTLEVNILNLTQETGVVNDIKGYFSIDVNIGDELYFSSLQFEPHQITVTQKVLDEKPYKVFLFLKVNELEEVFVSNSILSGISENDVKSIPVKPFFSAGNLGLPQATKPLPTVEERRIYTASSGPVELLVNTLNGELKKLKKLDEWAKLDKIVYEGKDAMATYYFEQYCGIPKDYIVDFVYYCAEDSNYKTLLKSDDVLKLFEFFESKAKGYKTSRPDVFQITESEK